MSRLTNGRIHRFGDYVAISLPGKGETLYLSASEAKQLAKGLNKCAREVGACKFTDSSFGEFVIPLANEGKR